MRRATPPAFPTEHGFPALPGTLVIPVFQKRLTLLHQESAAPWHLKYLWSYWEQQILHSWVQGLCLIQSDTQAGFFGLLKYNAKGSHYDEAMRNTADMVYNVFKYQLVKYLGVFNLIYQYTVAQQKGIKPEEVSGITTLLQKLEYNAFNSKALILSDYGVPFKLVDYYDDPNGRKNFDAYEQYIDSKITHIIQ